MASARYFSAPRKVHTRVTRLTTRDAQQYVFLPIFRGKCVQAVQSLLAKKLPHRVTFEPQVVYVCNCAIHPGPGPATICAGTVEHAHRCNKRVPGGEMQSSKASRQVCGMSRTIGQILNNPWHSCCSSVMGVNRCCPHQQRDGGGLWRHNSHRLTITLFSVPTCVA